MSKSAEELRFQLKDVDNRVEGLTAAAIAVIRELVILTTIAEQLRQELAQAKKEAGQ